MGANIILSFKFTNSIVAVTARKSERCCHSNLVFNSLVAVTARISERCCHSNLVF